jgi:hypothetical protein
LRASDGTHHPASSAGEQPISSPAIINRSDGVEINFEFAADEADGQSLAPDTQQEFRHDLYRDLERLADWAAAQQWPYVLPRLDIAVSRKYRISRSLVPAWSGRAGFMEFPSSRVIARRAAIAHELVHVAYPNANRLLAEGLAIHLQAVIGGNPAFPNFGRPLHEQALGLMWKMRPREGSGHDAQRFDWIELSQLERIATPNPLELRVGADFYGEEPRGQGHLYPIAGSFVQHLIETYGMEKFRALYAHTPLIPSQSNAGEYQRWTDAYRLSFDDLAGCWKSFLGGRGEASTLST